MRYSGGRRFFCAPRLSTPTATSGRPWTGDPAKDAESEAYNFDVEPFYAKWMNDVESIAKSRWFDSGCLDVLDCWRRGGMAQRIHDHPGLVHRLLRRSPRCGNALCRHEDMGLGDGEHEVADGTLEATSYGDWCDTYTMGGKVSDFGATPARVSFIARTNTTTSASWNGWRSKLATRKMSGLLPIWPTS